MGWSARFRELWLVHQAKHLGYGLLDDAVYYGGYTKLPSLAFLFGYLYPSYWIGAIASAKQTFSYFVLVFSQVWQPLGFVHSVYSTLPLLALTCLFALLRLAGVRMYSNIRSDVSCTSTSSSLTIPIKVALPHTFRVLRYSSDGNFLIFSVFLFTRRVYTFYQV